MVYKEVFQAGYKEVFQAGLSSGYAVWNLVKNQYPTPLSIYYSFLDEYYTIYAVLYRIY